MSVNRRTTPFAMFAATIVAAFAAVQCSSNSPTQSTTVAMSAVALSSPSIAAGATVQGTVTLTAAATAGGRTWRCRAATRR